MVFLRQAVHVSDSWDLVGQVFTLCFSVTCIYTWASQAASGRVCLPGQETQEMGFHPWVGKIPCRQKWQPTPVFLPGKSYGQRNPVGCSPWDRKEWTWLNDWGCMHIYLYIFYLVLFSSCWCTSIWPIVLSDILGILTLSKALLLHWFHIYIPLPFFQAFFLFLPASFFPFFPVLILPSLCSFNFYSL